MTTPDELRARVVDAAIRWHTGRENGVALVGHPRYALQVADDVALGEAVKALLADSVPRGSDAVPCSAWRRGARAGRFFFCANPLGHEGEHHMREEEP